MVEWEGKQGKNMGELSSGSRCIQAKWEHVFASGLIKVSKCLWEKLVFFFPSHKGNKISLEVTKMILVMTRGRVYHIVNGSLTPSMRSEEGLGRATREGRNFLSIVTVGPQVEPGGSRQNRPLVLHALVFRELEILQEKCARKSRIYPVRRR